MSRLKSMKRMGVILSSLAVCSFGIIADSSNSPAATSNVSPPNATCSPFRRAKRFSTCSKDIFAGGISRARRAS